MFLDLRIHDLEPRALRMMYLAFLCLSAHDFEPGTLTCPHGFRSNAFVPLSFLAHDDHFRIGICRPCSKPYLLSCLLVGAWNGGEVCTETRYSTARGVVR
ncbi:unnamed protein product [Ectocarpus sp. 12 AP-2014]